MSTFQIFCFSMIPMNIFLIVWCVLQYQRIRALEDKIEKMIPPEDCPKTKGLEDFLADIQRYGYGVVRVQAPGAFTPTTKGS